MGAWSRRRSPSSIAASCPGAALGSAVAGALACAAWLSETTAVGMPRLPPSPARRRLAGPGAFRASDGAEGTRRPGCASSRWEPRSEPSSERICSSRRRSPSGTRPGIENPLAYVRALAYDAGANALSAALFFHGALFSWLWRRFDFARATAGATAAILVRYLLDPALPRAVETAAGAVFYLGVLGVASCALRARTGGAAPAYAATLAFFAAYRSLSGR